MSDMTWRTSIAEVTPDEVIIRGNRLSDLVGNLTYTEMAFLVVRGSLPTAGERRMLDAVLVSLADHGISPTTIVARTLASCGTPIQASMAGAMLSIADWHGGSGEEVGRILDTIVRESSDPTDYEQASQDFVAAQRAARRQVAGFGHPQHTDGDPRARQLLDLADQLEVSGRYCAALRVLGQSLGEATGRPALRLPNVTGALAAILLDLGFPWQGIRGIVIAARSIGLTAHVVEELEQGNKWRHAPADAVQYTGPSPS
jgi:citrate synthase